MHADTMSAIVSYNEKASELLRRISEFGKELKWSCKEPIDPTAAEVEMKMAIDDMRGLIEMFCDVEDFVAATGCVDADRVDAAYAAAEGK